MAHLRQEHRIKATQEKEGEEEVSTKYVSHSDIGLDVDLECGRTVFVSLVGFPDGKYDYLSIKASTEIDDVGHEHLYILRDGKPVK